MKKIFFLIFLVMFLSPIFAIEDTSVTDNLENTTDSVCTMDVKECWDGSFVSRDPSRNCEFYSCPVQNNLDTDMCNNKIRELNTRIDDALNPILTQLEKQYAEFKNQERIYLQARQAVEICLKQTDSSAEINKKDLSAPSKITANIILSNSKITNLESANDFPTKQSAVLVENITTDQIIDDVITKDISIIRKEDFSLNVNKCVKEKEQYEIEYEKLKQLKERINQLKIQHKEVVQKLSDLKKERDTLIETCFKKNTTDACKVPEDLLIREKELIMEINNLKQLSLESLDKEEYLEKLKILRNEYRLVQEKINIIKESCNIQKDLKIVIEKSCAEKDELKKILDELYSLVNTTVDEKEIYLLKEKISYYEEKISQVSCDNIKTQDQKTDYLEKKIRELESEKEKLKSEITNLKSTITQLKEKFSLAKKDDKYALIFENSEDITEHTTAIIEKEIINLKKVLENINASSMLEETKEKIRAKLQVKIANLEQIKSNLSFVLTAEELETIVNDAKQSTITSKKTSAISLLEKNVLTLSSIIDKHLLKSKNYLLIREETDQLLKDISLVSIDSLTSEDIITFNKRYQDLKEKIRAEIN